MTQILVRGLDDHVKARLRRMADRRGSSLEGFVRDLLSEAAAADEQPTEGLGTRIARLFKGIGFTEEEARGLEQRGWTMEIPDFSE